ncbi:MAG: serine/threonine protein kinase [Gammaproteobacteria bacterium]|nr:serine/threonine protein kinase [Gammaproteobacteria bacterium]
MIHELGRGGMAHVYLALHKGLDRKVAIKVMYPNLATDSSFSKRFIREARILASLNHRNIITVFDVGVHNGHHYIAMEYLPGNRLHGKIKNGFNPQEALSIVKQIAVGLDVAHKNGFIHRDIKPGNILFRGDGAAVITDFGVARCEDVETKMTQTGTVIGTPRYMSPEQAQGSELKPCSDIYSLGVVFYEMLTGKVPYRADSTVGLMYKHVHEPVPNLPPSYQTYQALLNKLMAKNHTERFQNGSEIINAIENIQDEQPHATVTTRIKPQASIRKLKVLDKVKTSIKVINFDRVRHFLVSRPLTIGGVVVLLFTLGMTILSNYKQHAEEFVDTQRQTKAEPPVSLLAQEPQTNNKLSEEALALAAVSQHVNYDDQEEIKIAKETEGKIAIDKTAKGKEAENKEQLKQEASKALQLETAIRIKQQQQNEQKKIRTLISQAEKDLKSNRLKEAYRHYSKVLKLESKNDMARQGIKQVSGKYLDLAISNANQARFKKADYYFGQGKSIMPGHPKLAVTRKQIIHLRQNHKLAEEKKSTKFQPEPVESDTTPQVFGGF